MRVLALEPYGGGSHRYFLQNWQQHSRHQWTTLLLPPHHWKWRMRHAAVTFASQLNEQSAAGAWDRLFCSDMLDLAAFRGLAAPRISRLPTVLYFHENQLTYPVRRLDPRDDHFSFTNFTSALAADQVWFNSAFHRQQFLAALADWLKRMPDYQPLAELPKLADKCSVQWPGVDVPSELACGPQPGGAAPRFAPASPASPALAMAAPLRIAWAGRWEHDKNPETLFAALRILASREVPFELALFGEAFREQPAVFAEAREEFSGQLAHWGFVPSRRDYLQRLADQHVLVSTAGHEFFGLAVVEAMLLGVVPLLPRRLSYPELLATPSDDERPDHAGNHVGELVFYEAGEGNEPAALADGLCRLRAVQLQPPAWHALRTACRRRAERFEARRRWPAMDDALESLAGGP